MARNQIYHQTFFSSKFLFFRILTLLKLFTYNCRNIFPFSSRWLFTKSKIMYFFMPLGLLIKIFVTPPSLLHMLQSPIQLFYFPIFLPYDKHLLIKKCLPLSYLFYYVCLILLVSLLCHFKSLSSFVNFHFISKFLLTISQFCDMIL